MNSDSRFQSRACRCRTAAAALALVIFAGTAALAQNVEPGFRGLFNGKDLTGWAGRTNHWSVQDGAITGVTTTNNPARGNNFLIAQQDGTNLVVADFELRLSFKFTGDFGNSGVQYRSKDMGNFVVHGYQGDMENGTNYTGILYEEGGRGILALRGQAVVLKEDPEKPGKTKIEIIGGEGSAAAIQAAIRQGDWNDYVVVARGNHLQHFVNGKKAVDVRDEQSAKAAKSGILALQIHQGPPMKVQFRDIRIRVLE